MNLEDAPPLPALADQAARRARRLRLLEEQRAYARLLVTDIRLYHEEAVILGRLERDLAERLAKPLETARGRYRQRFSAEQDARIFEDEVVHILAAGEAGRLG